MMKIQDDRIFFRALRALRSQTCQPSYSLQSPLPVIFAFLGTLPSAHEKLPLQDFDGSGRRVRTFNLRLIEPLLYQLSYPATAEREESVRMNRSGSQGDRIENLSVELRDECQRFLVFVLGFGAATE